MTRINALYLDCNLLNMEYSFQPKIFRLKMEYSSFQPKIFRLKMECREIIPEILGLSQYGQE